MNFLNCSLKLFSLFSNFTLIKNYLNLIYLTIQGIINKKIKINLLICSKFFYTSKYDLRDRGLYMKISKKVSNILDFYRSDNPGVRSNLVRILMNGKLGGTGKLVILPVDQGFEHGPTRSFAINQNAYDPEYHFNLAIDAGLSAFAAPLGMIEACASSYAGQIPLIMKINSSNSLCRTSDSPTQAITGSVSEAIRLGCSAIGFTIYPDPMILLI